MRYLLFNYLTKPNGQIDEVMSVSKKLRTRDLQSASVIIDFRDLKVMQATLDGKTIPKDFDRIVQYYMQHYEQVIRRLFHENGYEVEVKKNEPESQDSAT